MCMQWDLRILFRWTARHGLSRPPCSLGADIHTPLHLGLWLGSQFKVANERGLQLVPACFSSSVPAPQHPAGAHWVSSSGVVNRQWNELSREQQGCRILLVHIGVSKYTNPPSMHGGMDKRKCMCNLLCSGFPLLGYAAAQAPGRW
jgi:hypothetical protein